MLRPAGRQAAELPDPERDGEGALRTVIDARGVWLTVLGMVGVVFALRNAQDFFIPLALAIFLSYALEPVASLLVRYGVPRAAAAALLLLSVVGAINFGVYSLSDDALEVARRLPVAARQFRESLRRQGGAPGAIDKAQEIATEIEKSAAAAAGADLPAQGVMRVQIEDKPLDVRSLLWYGSMSVFELFTNALLLLFMTYFFMASGDLFKRKLVKIAGPALSQKRVTVQVLDEISSQVQSFLFIQLITGTVVGVLSWGAFRWLGLEQAAVWGVAAGVLNTIPYFGPFIVACGLAIASLLQFGTLSAAASVVGVALLITAMEGFIFTPLLVGRAARMNEVAVFVSLMFWGWLWGPVGMLIAIPMMMAIKATCDHVEALESIGELLGD